MDDDEVGELIRAQVLEHCSPSLVCFDHAPDRRATAVRWHHVRGDVVAELLVGPGLLMEDGVTSMVGSPR